MAKERDLWPVITSVSNLFAAARSAAAGKKFRPDVARFLLDVEGNVLDLRRELVTGAYRPGPYRSFEVRDPKPRLISAAPFRDRVVHHALTRVIEPVFERRFSSASYACRKGMGTHAALTTARSAAERYPAVLKADVVRFFPSVDHEILLARLGRVLGCDETLGLARTILDGFAGPAEDPVYFPGDDLFTPIERRRGIPLGNQTSQFFANVYLDPLDQFVERRLRPRAYVRYVDDFLIFGITREECEEAGRQVAGFLCRLRLRLHPRKSRVYRCRDGVRFLGWRLFPGRTRLVRPNVVRMRRRLRELQEGYARGLVGWDFVTQRIASWNGHAAWGNTWRLREEMLGSTVFRRLPGKRRQRHAV